MMTDSTTLVLSRKKLLKISQCEKLSMNIVKVKKISSDFNYHELFPNFNKYTKISWFRKL